MKVGRFNPVDLFLFARALPLARRAQRARVTPIPALVADLYRHGGGFGGYPIDRLSLAAERATARWSSWFGGMNTCLVRSLVLGALLGDRGDVVLNVGFCPSDDPEPGLTGHAWVTVNSRPVGRDADLAATRYTRVLEVRYRDSVRDDT